MQRVEVSYRGASGAQGDIRYLKGEGPFNRFESTMHCMDLAFMLHFTPPPDFDIPGDYERALAGRLRYQKRLDEYVEELKSGKL